MSLNVILIPAYMPEEQFIDLAKELRRRNMDVLVVDDGSGKDYAERFERVEWFRVPVLHHTTNLGKGRAIKTGIAEIRKRWPSVTGIITADCDGQHSADDIEKIAGLMASRPDTFIVGGRNFDKDVPPRSRVGNTVTALIYRIFSGVKISDTQSGLRGLPSCLFDRLLELDGERYDYEMNMLLKLKSWDVDYLETPVETIYFANNTGSHYRTFQDSLLILKQFLSTAATSLISYTADYTLYLLFLKFTGLNVALCYLFARLCSTLLNYRLNSKLVFKAGGYASFAKYYLLAFCIMVTGSSGAYLLVNMLGLSRVFSKLFIDFPLFFVNFFAQKNFVFATKHRHKPS